MSFEQGKQDLGLVAEALEDRADARRRLLGRLACVRRMIGTLNARLGSPASKQDVEDVSQETLTAVWRKLGDFDGSSILESWVSRFCYLELVHFLRRKHRLMEVFPGELEGSALEPVTRDAHDFLDHALLIEHLEGLDEDLALVVRLKIFEDLTFEDVAERLEISPNTAKSRYYRGVRKLRGRLAGWKEVSR